MCFFQICLDVANDTGKEASQRRGQSEKAPNSRLVRPPRVLHLVTPRTLRENAPVSHTCIERNTRNKKA